MQRKAIISDALLQCRRHLCSGQLDSRVRILTSEVRPSPGPRRTTPCLTALIHIIAKYLHHTWAGRKNVLKQAVDGKAILSVRTDVCIKDASR